MSKPNQYGRRYEGKVALITGATKGIGFAIAERLGLEGAAVAICSRKQKNVDEAVNALKAKGVTHVVGFPIHVGTSEAREQLIQATVKHFGRIDVLVSNVALNPVMGPMLDVTTESVWDKIMDVNVKSHFFLVKSALPHMPAGGNVIIIASYAGYLPNPLLGAYSVSKTALLGLTKVLATELAPRQIRVNCVAPGIIKTNFSEALWKSDAAADVTLKDIPLQRFGLPEECASCVAFLASADGAFMTGEVLLPTGGVHARL
mgnify:CR=1 FL=1